MQILCVDLPLCLTGIGLSQNVENAKSRKVVIDNRRRRGPTGKNLGQLTALGAAFSFDDPLLANFGQKHYLTENHRVTFLFYLGYSFEALIYFNSLLLNPLTPLPLILVALLGHTSSKYGPDQ